MPGFEAFGIRYTSRGFDRIHRQQGLLTSSSKKLAHATIGANQASATFNKTMRQLAALGITTALIGKFISLADSFTNMTNRIAITSSSLDEIRSKLGSLFDIANRTRTDVATAAEVFSRFSLAGAQLGFTSEQLLVATESLSKAVVISGATSSEAQGAFIQLSQAFGSTQLRGQELTSVLEQIPRAAQAIAEEMGVPIGKLRELGQTGAITSQMVLNALITAAPKLAAEFDKTRATVAQSLVVLQNQLRLYAGVVSEALDVTLDLSRTITAFALSGLPALSRAAIVAAATIKTTFSDIFAAVESVRMGLFSLKDTAEDVFSFLTDGISGPLRGEGWFPNPTGGQVTTLKTVTGELEKLNESLKILSGLKPDVGAELYIQLNELTRLFADGKIGLDAYSRSLDNLQDKAKEGLRVKFNQSRNQELRDQLESAKREQEELAAYSPILNTTLETLRALSYVVPVVGESLREAADTLLEQTTPDALNTASEAVRRYEEALADITKGVDDARKAQLAHIKLLEDTEAIKKASELIQKLTNDTELFARAANETSDVTAAFLRVLSSMKPVDLKLKFGFEIDTKLTGAMSGVSETNPVGLVLSAQAQAALDKLKTLVNQDVYGDLGSAIDNAVSSGDEVIDKAQQLREIDTRIREVTALTVQQQQDILSPESFSLLQNSGPEALRAAMLKSLDKTKKDVKDVAEDLSSLFFDLFPARGVTNELTDQLELVSKGLAGGIPGLEKYGISMEDLQKAATLLGEKLADPIGKIKELNDTVVGYRSELFPSIAATDRYTKIMGDLGAHAATTGTNLNDLTDPRTILWMATAAKAGHDLADALNPEKASMLAELEAIGTDPLQRLYELLRLANEQLALGGPNAEKMSFAIAELNKQINETSTTFEHGASEALRKLTEEYTDGAYQIESTIANAFHAAEDALVDFVLTGKLSFEDLINSILADLARLAIQQAILAPITGAIGGLFSSTPIISGGLSASSAGSPSQSSFNASSASSGTNQIVIAPQVSVKVDATGATNPQAVGAETGAAVTKAIDKTIRAVVRDEIQRQSRPGGQINNKLITGIG